jgi:hypothetical protein
MDIRNELVPGGKALRIVEDVTLANAIGMFIILLGAACLLMRLGEPLAMIVGTAFIGIGIWGIWQTTAYEVVADNVKRTIRVETSSYRYTESTEVAFGDVEGIEYHDRRVHPGWGMKSYIAFMVGLRLNNGTLIPVSSDWGMYRDAKRRAAQSLARFIGVPCTVVNEQIE